MFEWIKNLIKPVAYDSFNSMKILLTDYNDLIPVVCDIYGIEKIQDLRINDTDNFLRVAKILRKYEMKKYGI